MGSRVVVISTFSEGYLTIGTLRLLGRGFLPVTALLAGSVALPFARVSGEGWQREPAREQGPVGK